MPFVTGMREMVTCIYASRSRATSSALNNPEVIPALRALFELVRSLGGTISGEHGIGLIQKEYMDIVNTGPAMEVMKGIKRVFDPKNILNSGKILISANKK